MKSYMYIFVTDLDEASYQNFFYLSRLLSYVALIHFSLFEGSYYFQELTTFLDAPH
jgi:hypothetical protein